MPQRQVPIAGSGGGPGTRIPQCLGLGGEVNAFFATGPGLVFGKQPGFEQVQGRGHRAGPPVVSLVPLAQHLPSSRCMITASLVTD